MRVDFDRMFPLSRIGKAYGLCMRVLGNINYRQSKNDCLDEIERNQQEEEVLNYLLELYIVIDHLIFPYNREDVFLTDVESLISALYNIRLLFSKESCYQISNTEICARVLLEKIIKNVEERIIQIDRAIDFNEAQLLNE